MQEDRNRQRHIESPSIALFPIWQRLKSRRAGANDGRFLARGEAVKSHEQGIVQLATVTEFDSVEQALAAHNSPADLEALKALGNACERKVRIVGGVD